MNVLVIGGAGFLGSHVADCLTRNGHDVTILDAAESPWLQSCQRFIKGDILDSGLIKEACTSAEVVFNFAAVADINMAAHNPVKTADVNFMGNVNVLEGCVSAGVKRYVFASTVYVNSLEGSFYRCTKQAAENYIREYQRQKSLDYTILRFGSLYGPRSETWNGLHKIVAKAVATGSIEYEGNSNATREYIHVADAALASVEALSEEHRNSTVNITGNDATRVKDVLETIAEIMGLPSKVIEFRQNEYAGHYIRTPYSYSKDYSRKMTLPGYIDLGEGLLELVENISSGSE